MEHKKSKRGYYEKQLTTNVINENGVKVRVTGLSKNSYEEACVDARKKKEEVERLNKIRVIENTPTTKEPLKHYVLLFMEYKHTKVATKHRWTDSTYSINMDIYNSKFAKSRIGNTQLKNLNVKKFQEFFDMLTITQGLGINYVKNIKLLLEQTFDYIDKNVCSIENYPKLCGLNYRFVDEIDLSYNGEDIEEEKGQVLTDEECLKIYEAAVDNYYRYGWAYVFMLASGCRPQEALSLTINDIDFEKREIIICKAIGRRKTREGKKECYIKTTKNRVIRKLYMDDIIEEAINGLIKRMPQGLDKNFDDKYSKSGLLIYNTKGGLLNVDIFTGEFKRLCNRYKINLRHGEGSYCLRHTWVTKNNLYYSKNPIAEAAILTSAAAGHKVETDLGTYTHIDTQFLKDYIKNPIKLSKEEQKQESEEYQEFLEFRKWKKMMEEQGN